MLAKIDRTGSIDRVEGSGYRAHDTVAFLQRETPDFIPSTVWTPNSPDLNVVNYSIWILLQEKVYYSRIITDLEKLKTCLGGLIDEWAQLNQSIVDAADGQWRHRQHAGHILSINSDNVEPICHGTNCSVK